MGGESTEKPEEGRRITQDIQQWTIEYLQRLREEKGTYPDNDAL